MAGVVRTDDDRMLSVEDWGDPGGRPVFLLHGTPGSRFGPRPRAALLYRLGIRLIAYDRPGYGDSTRLPGRSVARAAHDVATIADALGIESFAVVGRSGGGPHALGCAALLPHRVTRAAALVSPAPRDAAGLDWYAGMTPQNVERFNVAERGIVALAERIVPHADAIRADPVAHLPFVMDGLPASDRRVLSDFGIRTMLASNFSEAFKSSAAGWIDDVIAFVSPWGFDPAVITRPVVLWHGREDRFMPVGHSRWLARRVQSAALTIESGGHFGAMRVLPEILRELAWGPVEGG
jgi:pimeloyl-ACP methyl ester carboxylesterase